MPEQSTQDAEKVSLSLLLRLSKASFVFVFRSNPPLVTTSLFLSVIFAVIPIGTIYLEALIIDELIKMATTAAISNRFWVLTFVGVAIYVVNAALNKLSSIVNYKIDFDLDQKLDVVVSTKKLEMDIPFYDDPEIADTITRAERYSRQLPNFYRDMIRLFEVLIRSFSSLVVIITLSPLMALVSVLSSIPQALINMSITKKSMRFERDNEETYRKAGWEIGYVTNTEHTKEIRLLGIGDTLIQRALDKYKVLFSKRFGIYLHGQKLGIFALLIEITGVTINTILLVFRVISGELTIGKFNFYRSNLDRLENTVQTFLRQATALQERAIRIRLFVLDFLEKENEMKEGDIPFEYTIKPPLIEFKNVWFKYPKSDKYIFKNLNLTINPGENLAIVGENGAGKTTLINLVLRFYDPSKGEILIDGVNLKSINRPSYYKVIGTLFQKFKIYFYSVYDNIALSAMGKAENKESLIMAAKLVGVDDFVKDYKNGYDTLLNKMFRGGIEPSVGQQQKIALARTIFKDPPVIILDEPTSAIDPKAEYEIFENLLKFVKEKTMIIISHRFSTVRNADRIIVLEKGKIIEDGTHAQLMEIENGVYKHAFNLQKKGYE